MVSAMDTVGEFSMMVDCPELGQDGPGWGGESADSDAPAEFATSIACYSRPSMAHRGPSAGLSAARVRVKKGSRLRLPAGGHWGMVRLVIGPAGTERPRRGPV